MTPATQYTNRNVSANAAPTFARHDFRVRKSEGQPTALEPVHAATRRQSVQPWERAVTHSTDWPFLATCNTWLRRTQPRCCKSSSVPGRAAASAPISGCRCGRAWGCQTCRGPVLVAATPPARLEMLGGCHVAVGCHACTQRTDRRIQCVEGRSFPHKHARYKHRPETRSSRQWRQLPLPSQTKGV